MIGYALIFAFGCLTIALILNLWRLVRGPSSVDRILALDTMVINIIAAIMLYGIQMSTTDYFEAALLFAMVGFIATVAYCRFILRGDIIE